MNRFNANNMKGQAMDAFCWVVRHIAIHVADMVHHTPQQRRGPTADAANPATDTQEDSISHVGSHESCQQDNDADSQGSDESVVVTHVTPSPLPMKRHHHNLSPAVAKRLRLSPAMPASLSCSSVTATPPLSVFVSPIDISCGTRIPRLGDTTQRHDALVRCCPFVFEILKQSWYKLTRTQQASLLHGGPFFLARMKFIETILIVPQATYKTQLTVAKDLSIPHG